MIYSTSLFTVMEAGVIVLGIAFILTVVGMIIWALMREDKDRPVVPWGVRMRVEREKARLEIDALEVKRMGIEILRNNALEALKGENPAQAMAQIAAAAADPESAAGRAIREPY